MKLFFCCLLTIVVGCGASHLERIDASVDSGYPEIATEAAVDAGPCGPVDTTTFIPDIMHSPNPAHAGKCTAQEAADYAACEGGDSAKCTQFGIGQTAQQCGQCIETQKPDQTWGVVVFDKSVGTINIEGCVDDALMQLPYEKAKGGGGSCGDLLHSSFGCQEAACTACIGNAFDTCTSSSIMGGCVTYDKAVESTTGMCHALLGDAAPPATSNCAPNSSITDLAARRADFLTRMAQYMCGP